MVSNAFSGTGRRARSSRANRQRAAHLCKYYTRPEIARECSKLFDRFLSPNTLLIEPSAGGGAFLETTDRPVFAYDIAPEHPEVIPHDFIEADLAPVFREIGDVALIGNPPFGRRSSLALSFLNRGLGLAHTVGFILPTSFQRWDTQRKVDTRARLVLDHRLPEDAFTLLDRSYRLPCTFQVWAIGDEFPDLRLREAPATSHPDFEMMGYSPDSPSSMRHFASPWDFAVRFQGSCDFDRVYSPAECDRRHQWMMFNAKDEGALRRLLRIDFKALSRSRSVIPGFARSDVVACYTAMEQ
jgi:hypothetical protein